MSAHVETTDELDDLTLIDKVRRGEIGAYGDLYQRHVASAYHQARQLARCPATIDDLVHTAFARVLEALLAGRGPTAGFRAYLLTALRNVAYDATRRDRKLRVTGDITAIAPSGALSVPFHDRIIAHVERRWAARAFAELHQPWQVALWSTVIEARTPADIAPRLGVTLNGAAAVSYRARRGLRTAYLQQQLTAAGLDKRCVSTFALLGAWTRDDLGKRDSAHVDAHLDTCWHCRDRIRQLIEGNPTLAADRAKTCAATWIRTTQRSGRRHGSPPPVIERSTG